MMEQKELFSVAIVTYNNFNLLKETLVSVFTQDYPNIQLIVCDNESCDFDYIEIDQFINDNKSEQIKDVVVIRLNRHVSITSNAEQARKAAKGAFFKLIDCGNILTPHALTEAALAFERSSASAVMGRYKSCEYNAEFVFVPDKNEIIFLKNDFLSSSQHEVFPPDIYMFKGVPPRQLMLNYSGMNCGAYSYELIIFWRTKELAALDGFDESYSYLVEWPALMKLCAHEKAVCFIDEVTEYVREEYLSDWWVPMSKALGRPKLVECAEMLKNLAEPYIQINVTSSEKKRLIQRCKTTQTTLKLWETIQCDWEIRNVSDRVALKFHFWKSLLFIWINSVNIKDNLKKDLMILLGIALVSSLDFGFVSCPLVYRIIQILFLFFLLLFSLHLSVGGLRILLQHRFQRKQHE